MVIQELVKEIAGTRQINSKEQKSFKVGTQEFSPKNMSKIHAKKFMPQNLCQKIYAKKFLGDYNIRSK